MTMKWVPAEIKRLKTLAEEKGLSASAIAVIFGITKGAISGKCRRTGIKLSGSRTHKKIKKRSILMKPKRLRKRLHLQPREPVKVKVRKHLMQTTKVPTISALDKDLGMAEFYKRLGIPPIPDTYHCKYIHGDDISNGNHTWCGKPVYNGSKYCKGHYKRVYQPKQAIRSRIQPHYR